MMSFIEELRWRGMLHDIMPGTEEALNKESVGGYIGFDPTADSLHIGSLVQIMILLHFQRAGHKPIALIGGATGMVGDPSGKTKERNLLTKEQIDINLNGIKNQLEKILDFNPETKNHAELVNNYDWFGGISFLDFIRDVGKHISINYMLAKDAVKSRMETGLSFTEFSYPLIQGYDFFVLNRDKNCKIQLGGSDQWGNIVTGTELIRRLGGSDAYAATTPLITKADGSKFGKSEGGNVWLDPKKTSPYKFYQYWINASDEDSEKYVKIFTLKTKKEIDVLIAEHKTAPHLRILQKEVARDITIRVHSEEDLNVAIEASNILFGKSTSESLSKLSEEDFLAVFDGVPQADVSKALLGNDELLLSEVAVAQTSFLPSNGEFRRAIKENSFSLNKDKVRDDVTISKSNLIVGKYLLLQRGKKQYFIAKFV
ncbi:tyrosine--tRNA ligase [Salibacteraceae bacterium]|nr:tyrosine--tRNA ligase [Crocinitomicaceae bacterium]MCH9823144.1 tyrosine--tRNA ligase [Bacteroidota bacterium]MDA9967750.1 tyrosine--tRNA ligase [Salibacteraceae bacterium]MDC1204164.1 tyrosine--tRNA ligase [Salibacteraceae bacterium]